MALTDYEKYIRTEDLLSLQKTPDNLTCHDEMQFQIIHQAAELWMKLVDFELQGFVKRLGAGQIERAISSFDRIDKIQHVLLQQMDLLDTMSPTSYMTVRTGLGNGSGQESPGFKRMLKLPGEIVWPAFSSFLKTKSMSLRQIYEEPEQNHLYYKLAEGLVNYDQWLQTWRYRHLMLVYRIIGTGTPSLKGKPSDLLAHGMKQRFFPKLWKIRDELFSEWTESMKAKGKSTGYE